MVLTLTAFAKFNEKKSNSQALRNLGFFVAIVCVSARWISVV